MVRPWTLPGLHPVLHLISNLDGDIASIPLSFGDDLKLGTKTMVIKSQRQN